jgi:hypothetical protein
MLLVRPSLQTATNPVGPAEMLAVLVTAAVCNQLTVYVV